MDLDWDVVSAVALKNSKLETLTICMQSLPISDVYVLAVLHGQDNYLSKAVTANISWSDIGPLLAPARTTARTARKANLFQNRLYFQPRHH